MGPLWWKCSSNIAALGCYIVGGIIWGPRAGLGLDLGCILSFPSGKLFFQSWVIWSPPELCSTNIQNNPSLISLWSVYPSEAEAYLTEDKGLERDSRVGKSWRKWPGTGYFLCAVRRQFWIRLNTCRVWPLSSYMRCELCFHVGKESPWR